MWVMSVLALMGAAAAVTFGIERGHREPPKLPVWDIPRTTATFASMLGSMSGFAVASSIFVAGLRVIRGLTELEPMIGLFFTGFIVLVGTAVMFNQVPNHPKLGSARSLPGSTQSTVFTLATITFVVGVTNILLGLQPLLVDMELPYLASIFKWMLLGVALAGSANASMFVYRMTRFGRRIIFLVPATSLVLGTIYRLVLVPRAAGFWPSRSPELAITLFLFGVAVPAFLASSLLLLGISVEPASERERSTRQTWLLAYAQSASCCLVLLWWAIAEP